MKFSFAEIFQLCLFCVGVGVFINQTSGLKGEINILKDQTLIGIESIERRIEKNHSWTMAILKNQNIQIANIEKFLEEKYPEFIAPPNSEVKEIKSFDHYRRWE